MTLNLSQNPAKAVIFDLDGTLLDTARDICAYINDAMEKFGYPTVDKDSIVRFIGNGARNLVMRCIGKECPDEHVDEVLKYYNDVYASSDSSLTVPFEGIQELLMDLKSRGYKLIIITNKPQRNTDDLVEKFFKSVGFDAVIGQRTDIKCKPDKTATLAVLSELGVKPERTYFVGDGETDVLTSINAGTRGIAVLWGYRTKAQLSAAGAKTFVETAQELSSLISL